MSLAARCPACGTVFRVVQDQLRVSEGWVRCGRCAEVFNAIESLVDLESDVASWPPAPSRSSERVIEDLARVSHAGDLDDEPVAPSSFEAAVPPRREAPAAQESLPAAVETAQDAADFNAEPDGRAQAPDPPPFVRRAEQAARWRRPGVRAALGLLAVAAAALLAAQAGFVYRDLVAARWPATRAWLERACGVAACRIEAPRSIEALAVESSGLVRIEGTSLYRLSVVLRNRAAITLALPSLDLTLTDSQGGIIARRVVAPSDIGVRQTSLSALGELPMQATISTTERPISGYTIEIFYP